VTESPLATLRVWLPEPLSPEVARSVQRMRQTADVQHVVLMPDVHLARDVCNGAVVATRQLIYPAAVGGDIGCGMAAVATGGQADLLTDPRSAARLLAGLYQSVPTNKHPTARPLPISLQTVALSDRKLTKLAERDGRVQLGTLGRGNHFLEFQTDDENRLWMMVHSGSRGTGQAISRHHLQRCTSVSTGLGYLDAQSEAGRAYLSDVEWARTYAAENRVAMLRAVEILLREEFSVEIDWTSLIHNDHNHVRRESHFGDVYWVHRKGAQPAGAGKVGIVPGSMGTVSFHVTGRGCPESLLSCSHGAGRRLSRDAARRKFSVRQLERQLGNVWYDHRRSQQLCDEAPEAYKDVEVVMRAQRDLVRIARRLRPVLCYKGV
jgi:tRNA-splicing ligase RtcB (3'-phosphate/5'-hydroxy nucleic acid ligase)